MSRFHCQRVIDLPDDLRIQLVSDFRNDLNSNMVSCFQKQSNNRDIALYYIVYFDTTPLFFFSLRTTMIYADQINMSVEKKNSSNRLQKAIVLLSEKRQKVTADNLRAALIRLGESAEAIKDGRLFEWLKDMDTVFSFRQELQNPNSLAVFERAASCLELVDFCRCTTEKSKECQNLLGMGTGMGRHIFYTYIADIARKVYDVTSCEYLVLYAADTAPDYKLTQYYRNEYGFTSSKEYKTVKVWYDISCPLLILDMKRMLEDSDYYLHSDKYQDITNAIFKLESLQQMNTTNSAEQDNHTDEKTAVFLK